ncbi:VanW family protein [Desulfosporosinus sp.]|uniref:VanW family protein n=1 Tax=Desulfosporosinus sp. TaxID=157907 RepID=UPI0025BF42F0|nr:VanW family protein [Desulfosporosinus sp.]MBC2727638.1 VanW family protein [Desulfosporosinus sp.]
MKRSRLFIIALLLQLCVTLGFGTIVSFANTHDRAPEGLSVRGKDFSGLTRIQVSKLIRDTLPHAVIYEEQVYPLKWEGTYAEIERWLDLVFPVTKGSWFADVLQNFSRPSGVASADIIQLDRSEIIEQLQGFSKEINRPALSATIEFVDGQLKRSEGLSGLELDIEATWLKVAQEHEGKQVEAVVKDVPAKPSTSDIAKVGDNLGDYTTYFNPLDVQRTNNVRLAAIALNNQLIPPGEVFSFNDVVGERTADSGYSPAIVFVNQSRIQEIGGGICQDSSTLYQAVLQANLAIEEKHNHSLPVSYVLRGQDATVSYGILDFRFRNDTKGYLLISARTGANWLRIRLFGLADDKHPELQNPEGYPIGPESWDKDPK